MPAPFRATNVRPENAVPVYSLNLKKNKAALWGMNVGSVLLLFLFGWLFLTYVQQVRPGIMAEVIFVSVSPIYFVISLIGIFAVLIVVHELIHGIFFWTFTRQRPKFGLRGWYAFASAPGWYFPRRQYLVISLAPVVCLSVLGMILLVILPADVLALALFAVILNAASSVGDLWITVRLLCERRLVVVEDVGDGMYFYALG
ncbi:MAG: DUF3267 domain-containing protein [Anaerolineales bacterium]|jgi:uncharacterized membrane protein YhdT